MRRRFFWPTFAYPGIVWLVLLFVLPLYVVLALAFGTLDPLFLTPSPTWNPFQWDPTQFQYVFQHLFGENGFIGPVLIRTLVFVVVASVACLLIAYPVAYYVARFGGRRKGVILALLIAPFWISYMMRMLAWVNLLQTDGWVNKGLSLFGLFDVHTAWLDGRGTTVVFGLIYGYVPYMILPLFAGLDRIDQSMLEAARDLGASRFSTFRRVTLPMSKAAVVASLLLVTLPMVGDYFTNDLLSNSPSTAMFGNLINNASYVPQQTGQAAAFLVIMFAILLAPMLYYVRATNRDEGGDGVSGIETRALAGSLAVLDDDAEPSGSSGRAGWWRSPWRKPRILATVTWLYLAWSLLPVAVAILFSFNAGKSRTTWQGFSMRWYWGDPNLSVVHDPTLHGALGQTILLGVLTTVIAVPLGVAFALGLDRWHGRLPNGWNFTMLMSFVVPEIVMGISLYFVVTAVTSNTGSLPWVPFHAGTAGQVIGLVTFQMSYPVIIVRARLLTIGKQYEEAAADLGANRFEALRRVLFPMLFPAIFASAVLVFADVIDDFVIVQKLSSGADTEPVAVKIYNTARGAPTPALNALATLLLLAALIAIVVGYLGYRTLTRGEGKASLGSFAGQV